MRGFSNVDRVLVPGSCVDEAHKYLAAVGCEGLEGFALWVGRLQGDEFQVTETVIPRQEGLRLAGGVCVTVDCDELHRINVWLHKQGLLLIAQLHSHPTDAYHSETDDAYPIATTEGALSLVLPNFAAEPFKLRDCAVYRLQDGLWRELQAALVEQLIQIQD